MLRGHLRALLEVLFAGILAAPASAVTFALDTTMEIELRSPLGAGEILTLTGTSAMLGPVELHLLGGVVAEGFLEERVNNVSGTLDLPSFGLPGLADSRFDLFFQLHDVSSGDNVRTASPLLFFGRVDDLPGLNRLYETPASELLFDDLGASTGFVLGPGSFVFKAVPEPTTGSLLLLGLMVMSGAARRPRAIGSRSVFAPR